MTDARAGAPAGAGAPGGRLPGGGAGGAARGGTRGQIRRAAGRGGPGAGGQIRRARGARRRFFWRGADFWGRRAKKSPFLLYKEAGFFARFSLSDQS